MDGSLTEQFNKTFRSFRRLHGKFPFESEVSMGEFHMLKAVKQLAKGHAVPCDVHVSHIRGHMDMSMPAVSQLLSALEKKHLITRSITPGDRRKISVSLTDNGEELLRKAKAEADALVDAVVSRLGERDAKEFIRITTRIRGILETLPRELQHPCSSDQIVSGKDDHV